MLLHRTDPLFHDALEGAAPSGVECPNSSLLRVNQQDGQAIGGLDREQKSRNIGDESVAGARLCAIARG